MSVFLRKWKKHDSTGNEMGDFLAGQMQKCTQIDILTGYFFFDGIKSIQEALEKNPELKLRILVGMDAGIDTRELVCKIYEFENDNPPHNASELYIKQLKQFLAKFPPEQFTESQAKLFNHFSVMIEKGKLQIRKTRIANHSKLYIFHENNGEVSYCGGSSNFTYSGLKGRQEFNIHVTQELAGEVKEIFDELWDNALPIIDFSDMARTTECVPPEEIEKVLRKETPFATIAPFEACMKLMYEYLKLNHSDKTLECRIGEILDAVKYNKFSYQIDAVSRAKKILDSNGGVIIADVVGLGKSVMASLLAKLTNAPGVILAPPVLLEGEKGWNSYLKKFRLDEMGWRAFSMYDSSLQNQNAVRDALTIIIDEVHNLRNSQTSLYQELKAIVDGKRIICLSATPYNNRPDDLYSIIELFPGPEIAGEAKSSYLGKIQKIAKEHKKLIDERRTLTSATALKKNADKLKAKAEELRPLIYPVTIRRNRIDLLKNEKYYQEIGELIPTLCPPVNRKADLTKEQSDFYDAILNQYFAGGNPLFFGAMYKPETYISQSNRVSQNQGNLSNMICRFIVSRWESSPHAFSKTLQNLLNDLTASVNILEKTGIFFKGADDIDFENDPSCSIQTISQDDLQSLYANINKAKKSASVYAESSAVAGLKKNCPGRNIVSLPQHALQAFLQDLRSDLKALEQIQQEFIACGMDRPEKDGKLNALKKIIDAILNGKIGDDVQETGNPRKIIVFSHFADTARYICENLNKIPELSGKLLYADGSNIDKEKKSEIETHFMCSSSNESKSKSTEKMILVCTDVLSEGINLNQAGVVINYDISYNPVRVIQRLGRINRIDKKVFDRIYNVNFFPTGPEGTHQDINRIEDISVGKMKNIHSILGEDGYILSTDEEPQAFMDKINPETQELESASEETKIADLYQQGLKIKQLSTAFEIESYEAKLDGIGMRWSILSGDVPEMYIFSRNKAAMFATCIPDIANTEVAAYAISCYSVFEKLFTLSKSTPEQESLAFYAAEANPHWNAYRTYTDCNGYIPADIKPGKDQIDAVGYAEEQLEDSDDKAFLISRIKLNKAFAKKVCQCFENNDYEMLNKLIEQEREKQIIPRQNDDVQTVMVMGFHK